MKEIKQELIIEETGEKKEIFFYAKDDEFNLIPVGPIKISQKIMNEIMKGKFESVSMGCFVPEPICKLCQKCEHLNESKTKNRR